MSNKQLLNLLLFVRYVKGTRWDDVCRLVALMPKIIVLEKEWARKYKQDNPQWYPLKLEDRSTWSTYDTGECIDLRFYTEGGSKKLYCDVKLYDGNNVSGYRTDLRFTAKLLIPSSFVQELKESIMYKLDCIAVDAYEDHLKTQKKLWAEQFKKEVVANSIAKR